MVGSILGIAAFVGSILGIVGIFTDFYIFLIIGGCIVLIQCGYEVFFGAQNSFVTEIVFAIIGIIVSFFVNLVWWYGIFLGLCLDGIIIGGIGVIEDARSITFISRKNVRNLDTAKANEAMHSTFEPEQQKPIKKLFCKNCGTECGPNDTKCPNCGKRVRFVRKAINKKPLLIVTFCILFLSVIGLSIACTMLYQQNVESQSTITSLDELSQNLQRTIDRKNDKIKELEKDYSDLFSDFLDYGAKADFLDNYIAFVVSDDAYAYHTYDCHFFQNCDSYWAYNIEAAQSRGYSPCKVCH